MEVLEYPQICKIPVLGRNRGQNPTPKYAKIPFMAELGSLFLLPYGQKNQSTSAAKLILLIIAVEFSIGFRLRLEKCELEPNFAYYSAINLKVSIQAE